METQYILGMTIEVFKTGVTDEKQADEIKQLLLEHFPSTRVNFDLQDCDNILRIEGRDFTIPDVVLLVNQKGIFCKALD